MNSKEFLVMELLNLMEIEEVYHQMGKDTNPVHEQIEKIFERLKELNK